MGSASSFEVSRGFSSQVEERVLLVRLPCNPIFPIGPIYLADHLHKCFPDLPQRILDLAALPVLDVERVLLATIDQFRPTL
ncbi:MAG: radical SAM protein, partial [Cyanobacteriota bacterium]|nr:radical SAM protein [Cyanobacteriota bacterium]